MCWHRTSLRTCVKTTGCMMESITKQNKYFILLMNHTELEWANIFGLKHMHMLVIFLIIIFDIIHPSFIQFTKLSSAFPNLCITSYWYVKSIVFIQAPGAIINSTIFVQMYKNAYIIHAIFTVGELCNSPFSLN